MAIIMDSYGEKKLNMSKKDFETDGRHNGKWVFCPTGGYGCPYCDSEGICHIADPIEDCDDFGSYFESWEDWEEC